MLSKPNRLIATIFLGNEIVNVAISSVIAALLLPHLPAGAGEGLALLVGTLGILLIGDVTPKCLVWPRARGFSLAGGRAAPRVLARGRSRAVRAREDRRRDPLPAGGAGRAADPRDDLRGGVPRAGRRRRGDRHPRLGGEGAHPQHLRNDRSARRGDHDPPARRLHDPEGSAVRGAGRPVPPLPPVPDSGLRGRAAQRRRRPPFQAAAPPDGRGGEAAGVAGSRPASLRRPRGAETSSAAARVPEAEGAHRHRRGRVRGDVRDRDAGGRPRGAVRGDPGGARPGREGDRAAPRRFLPRPREDADPPFQRGVRDRDPGSGIRHGRRFPPPRVREDAGPRGKDLAGGHLLHRGADEGAADRRGRRAPRAAFEPEKEE